MPSESCDLLIVGAGINGAGIARDAALRGLDVIVCERGDIAGATSSASTKLAHGGLRYLEQGAFGLVRESLREREILSRIAAHLAHPQRFVVPHSGERPAWLLALGLTVYDRLAGRSTLPHAERLPPDFPLLAQLRAPVKGAHAYHDLWIDDARLTLTTLVDAAAHGARVHVHTALLAVQPHERRWRCTLSGPDGVREVDARCVANVAGPWMPDIEAMRGATPPPVRLVQGTHLVVPRLHEGDDAWLLQQPDRRIVFVIPYEADFHLVGTTETELASPSQLGATAAERAYLLGALTRSFGAHPDISWEFSGMRPLIGGGGSARTASREYRLQFDGGRDDRGWLSVQGGKLTTYRHLAERAVDLIAKHFGLSVRCSTAERPLPGADAALSGTALRLASQFPELPKDWLDALVRRHGTLAGQLVDDAVCCDGPGIDFGGGLFEAEARWCASREWASEAGDVLWRRTKCGLKMSPGQREHFTRWWALQRAG